MTESTTPTKIRPAFTLATGKLTPTSSWLSFDTGTRPWGRCLGFFGDFFLSLLLMRSSPLGVSLGKGMSRISAPASASRCWTCKGRVRITARRRKKEGGRYLYLILRDFGVIIDLYLAKRVFVFIFGSFF
jgi:hypothetical protein